MKRGAEKQLSKDDDADDEVEEVQAGFQMAKDSDLAKREIRGLPKRRSPAVAPALSQPSSGTTQPGAPPKFGGFSGFGAASGAAAPFTFASSSSPLAGLPLKPSVDAPAISESASNATKTFASFLGPSSTVGAKPVVSPSPSSFGTSKPDASGDTDEVALKYYTSLRGLNSSFLSTISKAIESDPFIDVADLLEQYKKHRVSVQQDYDGKSAHVKTPSASSAPSKPSIPAAPSSFKPATSAPATMPVPPTSFAGFAAPTSSAAPGTGFTPSPAPPTTEPSSFKFSSSSATSSGPKHAFAASSSPFSSFTGAASSSSHLKSAAPKEAESTPSLKPAFAVGAFASTGTTTSLSASPFGGGGSGATSTLLFSTPKTTSIFSSDRAGASEEKDKEKDNKPASSAPVPFSFNVAPGTKLFSDTSSSSGAPTSIFGSTTTTSSKPTEDKEKGQAEPIPSPPSSIFGGPFGSSTAKPSPFTFGTTASSTTPAPFGFGVAPGTSEGSTPPKAGSVGFSFGSPSRGPSSQTTTTTTTSPVFGSASTAAPAGTGGLSTSGSTPASTNASTPAPPASGHLDVHSSSATRGNTPATEGSLDEDGSVTPAGHGGEGEGEEDEETTYTVKAKVFKFTTDREGAPTWSEMGVGMLRLKKHKETSTRRVILRSNVTGKIIINFRMYPGLQPKRTAKTVAFTGHITSPGSETQTAQYRLRVGSEAAAIETAEAMEREVRLVKADSSPSS